MKNRFIAIVFSGLLLCACGGAPTTTAKYSPSSSTQGQASVSPASPSPSAVSASSNPATTLYTLAPQPGSTVRGTVHVAAAADGVTLTATVNGLDPSRSYIVDADPLPCEFFVGGPSQSFSKPLTVDANGSGTVVWTVPSGMDGNANVQALTSQGTYAVLACADLAS